MPSPKKKTEQTITLPKLNIQGIEVKIIGDSPLICHRWSEKAKAILLGRQMGTPNAGKEKKDPERDFQDSLYQYPGGGYGFPSVAFKSAAVSACRFVDAVKMTSARGAFHVLGELVRIEGTPQMREDMVRVGMGVADIRYRGEFPEWSALLQVRYNANALTAAEIVNLFNVAGFGVGIGEWRPEKDGSHGMFHVE